MVLQLGQALFKNTSTVKFGIKSLFLSLEMASQMTAPRALHVFDSMSPSLLRPHGPPDHHGLSNGLRSACVNPKIEFHAFLLTVEDCQQFILETVTSNSTVPPVAWRDTISIRGGWKGALLFLTLLSFDCNLFIPVAHSGLQPLHSYQWILPSLGVS